MIMIAYFLAFIAIVHSQQESQSAKGYGEEQDSPQPLFHEEFEHNIDGTSSLAARSLADHGEREREYGPKASELVGYQDQRRLGNQAEEMEELEMSFDGSVVRRHYQSDGELADSGAKRRLVEGGVATTKISTVGAQETDLRHYRVG